MSQNKNGFCSVEPACPSSAHALLYFSKSKWQSIGINDRMGNEILIHAQCFLHKGRLHCFLVSSCLSEARRIEKNAEYLAQQLVDQLQIKTSSFNIVHCIDVISTTFWRWDFNWVGNSPIQKNPIELTCAASERLVKQITSKGTYINLTLKELSQHKQLLGDAVA